MVKSHSHGIILALVFFVLLLTIGCATAPRAYIGVQLDDHNLVKKVLPNKPAHQAGIRSGDIILGIKKDEVKDTSLGNKEKAPVDILTDSLAAFFGSKDKIEDSSSGDSKNSLGAGSVQEQIHRLPIGKPASIVISRNGQKLTLPITATYTPPPLPRLQRILNSWMGGNINDYSRANGYPTRSFIAPNGNKVYEYASSSTVTIPPTYLPGTATLTPQYGGGYTINQNPGIQVGGGTRTYHCKLWLEVDGQGTILLWSYKGNNCN